MERQTFKGPFPGMQQQDKSICSLILQAQPTPTPLSLTFLLIHHIGAWEFTRPKKVLSTKVKLPTLEFPHLNAQRVWMNVFP